MIIVFDNETRQFSAFDETREFGEKAKAFWSGAGGKKGAHSLITTVGGGLVGGTAGALIARNKAKRKAEQLGLEPGTPEYKKFMRQQGAKGAAIGAGAGAAAGWVGDTAVTMIKNRKKGGSFGDQFKASQGWHLGTKPVSPTGGSGSGSSKSGGAGSGGSKSGGSGSGSSKSGSSGSGSSKPIALIEGPTQSQQGSTPAESIKKVRAGKSNKGHHYEAVDRGNTKSQIAGKVVGKGLRGESETNVNKSVAGKIIADTRKTREIRKQLQPATSKDAQDFRAWFKENFNNGKGYSREEIKEIKRQWGLQRNIFFSKTFSLYPRF